MDGQLSLKVIHAVLVLACTKISGAHFETLSTSETPQPRGFPLLNGPSPCGT
jgi:hypothetical protein